MNKRSLQAVYILLMLPFTILAILAAIFNFAVWAFDLSSMAVWVREWFAVCSIFLAIIIPMVVFLAAREDEEG